MNKFRLGLILRAVFIALCFCAAAISFVKEYYIFAAIMAAAAAWTVKMLIQFVSITNSELIKLLEAVSYSDFSVNFNFGSYGGNFKDLSEEFNRIMEKFRTARAESEESLRYLETVVQHVGVGLISFDMKGEVGLINKAAKKILNINGIKNLSALEKNNPDLCSFIFTLKSGKKAAYKFTEDNETAQLLLYATDFRMKNNSYKLVALQNIQPELEEREIDAWQKLIRVLTHEIMNSVTPISSLASTVNAMLPSPGEEQRIIDGEMLDDIKTALATIKKRSEGLVSFVEKYRSLTKIPKPNFQIFKAEQLFARIRILIDSALPAEQVKITAEVKPSYLELTADSDLIEQVLINLLNNAIQSITLAGITNGEVNLNAGIDHRGRAFIDVKDNGPGVSEEIAEKIFIPFFSTKKDGSGIGLSLSQQIMRAHGGSISVRSKPGVETVFTIRF
jgi:nitrogen fixation/metabolism regulation signal transduction histidine kinase